MNCLRLIEVVQRGGQRWRELGYYLDSVPGLAVTQTERSGSTWWTLTHLLTGHSVGIVVADKDRAARIGAELADLDWRHKTYPPATVRRMYERVREVAERAGLKAWTETTGVEYLEPELAQLVREDLRARMAAQLAAHAAPQKETACQA